MQVMQQGERVIHYRADLGRAGRPTVVFINSLGTDFRIWDGVVHHLGGHYNVVLHNKRGHGLSGLGPGPHAISDYARDVTVLLHHLGVTEAILCGLSVGGIIAQDLLLGRPDLVRAAILSNTGAKVGTAESWDARIAAVAASGIASISDMVIERWFSPNFRHGRSDELALYTNMLTRTDPQAYIACCEAIRDADFRSQLSAISRPVLCIGGSHDGSTPPALVQELASGIPGAQFLLMPDSAHLPCIEEPQAYAEAISGFIDGV